jgi:hypothetical protein
MTIVLDILRWTIAIGSVLATLALITWLAMMFFKKDTRE